MANKVRGGTRTQDERDYTVHGPPERAHRRRVPEHRVKPGQRQVMTSGAADRGMPLAQAARELGISDRTLRHYLELGAPCISPGARGAGRGAIVDPAAVRAWLVARKGVDAYRSLRDFAPLIPRIAARAAYRVYQQRPSAALAYDIVQTWFAVTSDLHSAAGAGEITDVPPEIRRLQDQIGKQF